MKHLGDITKINGAEIEPVDVITGGSPCQDLSIAGKRAGLEGARSGLFMEQIRIVKEMRDCDRRMGRTGEFVRPRYMVWENVPGAFSSNKGKDFAAVLEEIIRIAEPEAPDIEVPEKSWNTWGGYHDEVGGRWSVAWRVHDAQYWGVPQRRRRISVVADFGGDTAGEILFERKSVPGHPAESGTEGERLAGNAESGSSYAVRIRGGCDGGGKGALVQTEKNGTLGTGNDQTLFCMATQQGGAEVRGDDRAPTLTASAGMSGNNQPVVCAGFKLGNSEQARSIGYAEEQSPTLNAECGGNKPAVIAFAQNQREEVRNVGDKAVSLAAEAGMHCQTFVALDMSHACDVIRHCGECAPSLQARMGTGGNQVPLTYQMQGFGDYRNFCEGGEINGTLQAKESGGQSLNLNNTVRQNMVVRRLTPMECERLQGFPECMEMDVEEMTKDEYIAVNIATGQIVVDCESGEIYTTKGPGGVRLKEPKKLDGSNVNGYKVVSIRNGQTKMQCRVHRIVWIARNGVIPNGCVVDHINNDKTDNRICNLQLLTAEENSHKAWQDGRYLMGDDSPSTKLPVSKRKEIVELYKSGEYTMRQLANDFGISKSRVHQIVKTSGWTDIGEWTDSKGKRHKDADSPRYKALGNSIALPFWDWMLRRMSRYLPEGATMGSLFDGIGGFPLVFERHNGKGTARWASEIEEFPIAVTKLRFGEE